MTHRSPYLSEFVWILVKVGIAPLHPGETQWFLSGFPLYLEDFGYSLIREIRVLLKSHEKTARMLEKATLDILILKMTNELPCLSSISTDNHFAPPDVTTGLVEHLHHERPQVASVRGVPRGYHSSILETADGDCVTNLLPFNLCPFFWISKCKTELDTHHVVCACPLQSFAVVWCICQSTTGWENVLHFLCCAGRAMSPFLYISIVKGNVSPLVSHSNFILPQSLEFQWM